MLPLISNFCYIVYFDLLWYTFFSFLYGELCDGRARSSARHAGQPRVSEVCGLPASACVNQLTQLRLSPPISSVLSLGEFLWTRRTFGILFRLHFPWRCTAWIRDVDAFAVYPRPGTLLFQVQLALEWCVVSFWRPLWKCGFTIRFFFPIRSKFYCVRF